MQPDEISVRQARDLLTPFSRFHLTMDTLGVRLYPSRYRAGSGLSPVRTCAHRAHYKISGGVFPARFVIHLKAV